MTEFKERVLGQFLIIRLNEILSKSKVDFSLLDEQIVESMNEIGISLREADQEPLYRDIKKYFGVSEVDFKGWLEIEKRMAFDAYEVFRAWSIQNDGNLEILHQDFYHGIGGQTTHPVFTLEGDRQLPEREGYLCRFNHEPLYVHFSKRTHNWKIEVKGQNAKLFLIELEDLLKAYFVKQYKGLQLNHKLQPVVFKEYSMNNLVYSKKLECQIKDLLTSFHNWTNSTLVSQWGYILIGRPGTGKTTIGGLLAKERKKGCTFLYCPASEVDSPNVVNQLFEIARILAPTVIQIDDVDLISKDRNTNGNVSLTSALMENLDGLKEGAKIFTLLTTNDPGKMEKAIINRAGRVSGKIIFNGYSDCLKELILKGRDDFHLSLSDDEIESGMADIPEEERDLTPDEAMNVCKRLHLLYGPKPISKLQLIQVIQDTYDAFDNADYQKSYLDLEKKKHDERNEIHLY